jgi:hypothetical protein
MHRNPLWMTRIDVVAPTHAWLRRLQTTIAASAQIRISYVELAVDVLFESTQKSHAMQAAMAKHVKWQYRRAAVTYHQGTMYCGARSEAGKKNLHAVALYADRPSKLEIAHTTVKSGACAHLEHRLAGSKTLAAVGIQSVQDLIGFDHVAYHDRMNCVYQLPNQTRLGLLLAQQCDVRDVGEAALRKRARKWHQDHEMNDGVFCLHNALRTTPGVDRHFAREDFLPWLKRTAVRIANEK